ncbi:MAG: box helicase, ATP-dependent helicase RhlE [Candidatus Adlerbacteria bacterium]|nr:box helicase, ATP-dependent helicase RhlE [Candidatus Adlerbacteria bacterium]
MFNKTPRSGNDSSTGPKFRARRFGGSSSSSSSSRGSSSTPRSGGSTSFAPRTGGSSYAPRTGGSSFAPRTGGSSFAPRSGGFSRGASSGGRPYSNGNRSGGSRFGGGSRGGRGNGGPAGLDPRNFERFINKTIITEVEEVFIPEHKFADFMIDDRLKRSIIEKGFVTPTPIQDKSIPHVLAGRDVVGIANTGTGKTGAFLIPLIHKALVAPATRILVVVPTRELAVQIADELKSLSIGLGIYHAVCVGGVNIFPQKSALRRGPQFVIGTPGRLKDLMEQKALNLAPFETVVLDEADRMLDMGFVNDMRHVMLQMNSNRQTLFFSATLSPEIEKLIGEFLKEPVRVSVKTRDTSKNVEQDVVHVESAKKLDTLHDLLTQPEFSKVLVFGRTKHGVEKLAKSLADRGFKTESIHGNKTQQRRQKALTQFKDGRVAVLVATDVAARGLDIADVSHVINYDLPTNYDDYVHRIGRTGRAGKRGKALTFIEGQKRG